MGLVYNHRERNGRLKTQLYANWVQNTLSFVNDEASSIHGNLRLSSVYISSSGEWRLGGFEVLSSMKDDDAIIYVCAPVTD